MDLVDEDITLEASPKLYLWERSAVQKSLVERLQSDGADYVQTQWTGINQTSSDGRAEELLLSASIAAPAHITHFIGALEEAEVVVRELAAEWVARNCFFMGAFDKETGAFVAQVYVGPVRWEVPEFEVGFFADVNHEGQGYVTEAAKAALGFIFEHLKGHRVRLRCDDTNRRSWRVAERCGMVREGHLRENKRNADGTLSGTLIYGLLREEFERHSTDTSR